MKHFEAKYWPAGNYWRIYSCDCYMGNVFLQFGKPYFSPAAEGTYDAASDCILAQSPNMDYSFVCYLIDFMQSGPDALKP